MWANKVGNPKLSYEEDVKIKVTKSVSNIHLIEEHMDNGYGQIHKMIRLKLSKDYTCDAHSEVSCSTSPNDEVMNIVWDYIQ